MAPRLPRCVFLQLSGSHLTTCMPNTTGMVRGSGGRGHMVGEGLDKSEDVHLHAFCSHAHGVLVCTQLVFECYIMHGCAWNKANLYMHTSTRYCLALSPIIMGVE